MTSAGSVWIALVELLTSDAASAQKIIAEHVERDGGCSKCASAARGTRESHPCTLRKAALRADQLREAQQGDVQPDPGPESPGTA
jgi:hypothetical protein